MGSRRKTSTKSFYMGSDLYDRAKWVAQIGLPAAGTLYFALATVWEWSNAEQVLGTITAVDTFLGVLLGISSKSYHNSGANVDGALVVQEDADGTKRVSLELHEDAAVLADQQQLIFRVLDKDRHA